ncbi:transcription elongation factor subunit spt4 isoform 2-T2 [Aphomia sociella]
MSLETVPKDLRGLRACLVCSLIKTFDQFEYDGCDNCDEFLCMKSNKDNVYDCTSNNFDGSILQRSICNICIGSVTCWCDKRNEEPRLRIPTEGY